MWYVFNTIKYDQTTYMSKNILYSMFYLPAPIFIIAFFRCIHVLDDLRFADADKSIHHHHIPELMPQRNYKSLIWLLTVAINGLIALAFFLPKIPALKGYDFSKLPLLNAILNGLTFCSLVIALLAIRRKKVPLHRTFVFLAFVFTSIFLFSYLLYHFTTPSTKYGGDGILRTAYFFILVTHVFLAALIVPLALLTMAFGLNNQINRHRKIARWTMPIWLYVSATGVIVYLLISSYYHH